MEDLIGTWSRLPEHVLWKIFSFLEPIDLVGLLRVCVRWNAILNDDSYWFQHLLEQKICNASGMEQSHLIEFLEKREMQLGLEVIVLNKKCASSQHVYFMTCPELSRKWRHYHQVTSNQGNLEPKHVPFWQRPFLSFGPFVTVNKNNDPSDVIIMFGPGLESPRTSYVARKLVTEDGGIIRVVGLCAGKEPGIGSGVVVSYNGEPLQIITMYSNIRSVRENLEGEARLSHSSLFIKKEKGWQLTERAGRLCEDVHGLIYVIDATLQAEEDDPYLDLPIVLSSCLRTNSENCHDSSASCVSSSSSSVESVEMKCADQKSLLVLACTSQQSCPRKTFHHLLMKLKLWQYDIPWQVCLLNKDNFENMHLGLSWMLSQLSME